MVLPYSMRLRGHKCFDHLHRSGTRFHSSSMILRVVKAKPSLLKSFPKNVTSHPCRCAVTISSKVSKKAVIRNRLRRMLHLHLKERLSKAKYYHDIWALISLKPNSYCKELTSLLTECDTLLYESGLIS